MNRILNEVAEEEAMLHYEDELTEELQAEADRINYGNAHKGTHVTVNRMRDPALGLAESYMKVSPPLLLLSKRVQSKLTDLLKDKRDGGKQTNLSWAGESIHVTFSRMTAIISITTVFPRKR